MKSLIVKAVAIVCLLAMLASMIVIPTGAVSYRTGANSVSSSYAGSRYYRNLMQVPLTGDGVTDVLAVALSQLGYQEGSSAGAYSGESGGSYNYTEYYYNFGMATNTWSMEWCAAFCSWALLQSGVSPHNKLNQWCRDHKGDGNYIWREISCYHWADQLKRVGRYGYRGSYTPTSGDLIFFNRSGGIGHIGLVVWCDGSRVYTIEGNPSSGSGVDGNGGGVYYKSYALSDSGINGYGRLPYASNPSAPKVDYSGNSFSTGLFMTKTGKTVSAGGFSIPPHRMFRVTSISGNSATVEYEGRTGTVTLNKSQMLQISASGGASTGGSSPSTPASLPNFVFHEANTYNAIGSIVPDVVKDDPNIRVTGFNGRLYSSWGLEDYGNNKNLIYINGRSWDEWNQGANPLALDRIAVVDAGDSACYFVFDLSNPSILRLNTQAGTGEVIDTIVLKKGFTLVNPTSDLWGQDGLLANSQYVASEVGRLQTDVLLKAKDGGGFTVTAATTELVFNESYSYNSLSESNLAPPTEVADDPSIHITGFSGAINSSWGIEKWGGNSSYIYVNGKSWDEWNRGTSPLPLDRVSVISGGSDHCWLVFDLSNHDVLKLSGQEGAGEVIYEIKIKSGFKLINTKSDMWGTDDGILIDGNAVAGVVGVLPQDITLIAKGSGGFEVIVGNTELVFNESNSYNSLSESNLAPPAEVADDPSIHITGFSGAINSSWGIEKWGGNSSYIYVNGKSWNEWNEGKYPLPLDRVSIISGGRDHCWMVFDLSNHDVLKLNGQDGAGEVIYEIKLKRGFKLINTKRDMWGTDNGILIDGNAVEGVVGVLTQDVVLTAKAGGGFTVSAESLHVHNYVLQYSEEGHYTECGCGSTTDLEAHQLERGTCSCGYHEHVYDEKGYDAEKHWDACSCGNIMNEAAHKLSKGTCSCGYHEHVYSNVKYDVEYHWAVCDCGNATSEEESHKFENGTCSCGYHKHVYDKIKYDDKYHWTECACGAINHTVSHIMENGACTRCEYSETMIEEILPAPQPGADVEQNGGEQDDQQQSETQNKPQTEQQNKPQTEQQSKPEQEQQKDQQEETKPTTNKKVGCASSLSVTSLTAAVLLLLGTGVILNKKKEF